MDSMAQATPTRYAFGAERAHTAGRCPPTYVPVAPAVEWSDAEIDEWLDAAARDAMRENGGGW